MGDTISGFGGRPEEFLVTAQNVKEPLDAIKEFGGFNRETMTFAGDAEFSEVVENILNVITGGDMLRSDEVGPPIQGALGFLASDGCLDTEQMK